MAQPAYKSFYVRVVKRLLDIVLSLIALPFVLVIALVFGIAIWLEDRGPVCYNAPRMGKDRVPFKMYKLRSMKVNAEFTGSGVYSDDKDDRITKVGKVLRKTSLDELPQLFNVLLGQIALVGPRSPLTYHPWPLEQYTTEQRKMFDVRPGITGWAQVHGRKTVEWHKRIEMNVWYSEHVSFWLDLKILFMTVFKVFSGADNENVGATLKE